MIAVSHQSKVLSLSLQYLCNLDHIDTTNHLSALAAASLLGLVRDHAHPARELCLDLESRQTLERLHTEADAMETHLDDLSSLHSLKNLLHSFVT